MKIGIYLGYGPSTLLHKEGLGRYLAVLIKGFTDQGHHVVVAMPKWLIKSFELLAEDWNIDVGELDFLIEHRSPIIWQIYNSFLLKRKPKRSIKERIRYSLSEIGECLLGVILSITNVFLFVGLGIVALLAIILAIPFMLLVFISGFIYILVKKITGVGKNKGKKIGEEILKFIFQFKEPGFDIYYKIYEKMLKSVRKSLVRKINLRDIEVDIWYSPSIFWPEFNDIQSVTIVNAPDLVVMDYPLHWYDKRTVIENSLLCEKTIEGAENFITYCNYVKDSLLIRRYNKNGDRIKVIPHIVNDLKDYVEIDAAVALKNMSSEIFTKSFCRTLLEDSKYNISFLDEYIKEYVKNFSFKDVKYIFYASQARPHKNLLNLLKAYECLLRKHFGGVKLFLTGDIFKEPELLTFIKEKELQYDVFPFYNVSSRQLAALYHEAELVINPTLYEGGFPFTFGEGMSVGTPSIMSDIPQIRECVGDKIDKCLFDPYDVNDMVEKMAWGLQHRSELIKLQEPLYVRLYARTERQYVEDYINAFSLLIRS